MAVLCRRLYGRHILPRAGHLQDAVKRVADGTYDKALKKLMSTGTDELKKIYKEREKEPQMAEEDWTPESGDFL